MIPTLRDDNHFNYIVDVLPDFSYAYLTLFVKTNMGF